MQTVFYLLNLVFPLTLNSHQVKALFQIYFPQCDKAPIKDLHARGGNGNKFK